MPWGTSTVSELRTALVHAVRTAKRPVAQAAREFGISRKTAYKWLALFDTQKPLADRSRRPTRSPARTSDALEAAVLAVRDQYGWGARKIHAYLTNNQQPTPPIRTTAAILRRHQRITPPAATPPTDCQRFERGTPNELWQLDFKGWIEIERQKVSPLTILDDHSRFLLALRPCTDLTMLTAWNVLWDTFGEYGLPEAVLCDNAFGTPSCPGTRGGLVVRVAAAAPGHPPHPRTPIPPADARQGRTPPRHVGPRGVPPPGHPFPGRIHGGVGSVASGRLQPATPARGVGRPAAADTLAAEFTPPSRRATRGHISFGVRSSSGRLQRPVPLPLRTHPGRTGPRRRVGSYRGCGWVRRRVLRRQRDPPHPARQPYTDGYSVNVCSVTHVPATRATYVPALNTSATLGGSGEAWVRFARPGFASFARRTRCASP